MALNADDIAKPAADKPGGYQRMIPMIILATVVMIPAMAQVRNYQPVTKEMLLDPKPEDWLMYSRTYDAQRFSPLKQINKQNVSRLRLAWELGMGPGETETIR